MDIKRTEIGKGIHFCTIRDERYKNNRITVNFMTPINEENVSANAVIPNLIDKNNSVYPDKTDFARKLNSLYGARFFSFVSVVGNSQIITAGADFIDNRYAFDKENMSVELANIICDCILAPVMINGKFEEETFENEKKNLLDDIQADINDKKTYARNRANEAMFKGQPCGIHKLGTKTTAEQVSNEKAVNAYNALLKTARIEIIFTGSGSSQEAKEIFTERFSQVERQEIAALSNVDSKIKENTEKITETMDVEQSVIVLGFKMDDNDSFSSALMNSIYGGTPTAKLFSNVRERMSLCYFCSSAVNRFTNSMTVICGVQKQNIDKATKAIIAQFEDMKNGKITEDEIKEAKLHLNNAYQSVCDSTAALENWFMYQIYEGESMLPEEKAEKVNAVTKERIVESANSMKLDTVYVLTSGEEQ